MSGSGQAVFQEGLHRPGAVRNARQRLRILLARRRWGPHAFDSAWPRHRLALHSNSSVSSFVLLVRFAFIRLVVETRVADAEVRSKRERREENK